MVFKEKNCTGYKILLKFAVFSLPVPPSAPGYSPPFPSTSKLTTGSGVCGSKIGSLLSTAL
jgi:hypothetical protein